MQILTVGEIRSIKRDVERRYADMPRTQIRVRQRFEISMAIIQRATGLVGEALKRAAAGYLNPDVPEGEGLRNVRQILELGDLLYLLKDVTGFDHFVKRLRTDPWEQEVAVLRVAGAFFRSGHRLSFIPESGTKTEDYDLALDVDGVDVHLEAKCKLEGTAYSSQGLLSTLSKAREQLPKDGPGVLIVTIPETWFVDERFKQEVGQVVARALGKTGRVNGVLLVGTVSRRTEEAYFFENWTWYQPNPKARTRVEGLERLITAVKVPAEPGTTSRVFSSYWVDD